MLLPCIINNDYTLLINNVIIILFHMQLYYFWFSKENMCLWYIGLRNAWVQKDFYSGI